MSDGDDRHIPQMADDDANDSQALTGGEITRCVCCAMANPSASDLERVGSGDTSLGSESRVLVPLAAEWRAGSVFRR